MRYVRPVLWLVLLTLAVSCREGRNPGRSAGDAEPGDVAGDADPVGDDDGGACEPGQIRDGAGVCRTVCTDNDDCGDPLLVCNTVLGLCVDGGDEPCDPANCAAGTTCPDPASGETDCVPIPGWCGEDADCGITERCENNACISRVGDVVMTCESDDDCNDAGGMLLSCQAGVCVGCLDDLQCGEGGKCVLGACVTADLGPAGECIGMECPDGTRCILSTGTCETVCSSNTDCDAGETCMPLLNYCVPEFGCDDERPCCEGPIERSCVIPMQCVAGLCLGCTSDADCAASESCTAGACFPDVGGGQCGDVTCAEGELCDPQDGSCYPEDGSCADASDCREGQTCASFLHLCTGCSVDGDCRPGQRCLLSACVPL